MTGKPQSDLVPVSWYGTAIGEAYLGHDGELILNLFPTRVPDSMKEALRQPNVLRLVIEPKFTPPERRLKSL